MKSEITKGYFARGIACIVSAQPIFPGCVLRRRDQDITVCESYNDMVRHMCTFGYCVPFIHLNEQPRPQLGRNMSIQALCKPYVRTSEYNEPLNIYPPIIATAAGNAM